MYTGISHRRKFGYIWGSQAPLPDVAGNVVSSGTVKPHWAYTELSVDWVNPRVGSRFFDFWWVGLGRGSETAETQKLQIFICAEFIEATNVVDTDGHGVSRQISQMFASNCFVNLLFGASLISSLLRLDSCLFFVPKGLLLFLWHRLGCGLGWVLDPNFHSGMGWVGLVIWSVDGLG